MSKKSEAQIEAAVCKMAEGMGFLQYKFVSPGKRGVPDRLFATAKSYTPILFFIEFKRPGGVLSNHQIKVIKELKTKAVHTIIIDSEYFAEEFFGSIIELIKDPSIDPQDVTDYLEAMSAQSLNG